MPTVFLCTSDYYDFLPPACARLRYTMFNLCHARWEAQLGVKVEVISPKALNCSRQEFQRSRRIYAEERRGGQYFIVADDDCFLSHDFDLEAAIAQMESHPDFMVLSLRPYPANIVPWTPEGYTPHVDTEVEEHVSVGGIRFCRPTKLYADWPPMPISGGYDALHAEALRKRGKRVGYLNQKCIHLGEGITSVWR